MTVHELKGILEDYETDGKGDLEVRIAEQPTWPLASDVSAVSRIGDTVWIADSRSADYAPKAAWDGVDIDEEGALEISRRARGTPPWTTRACAAWASPCQAQRRLLQR